MVTSSEIMLCSVFSKSLNAKPFFARLFTQQMGSPESVARNKQEIREMIKKASMDLKKRADNGDASSQASYGEFLESGKITKKEEPELAYKYYKMSAEKEDPNGLFNLGRAYLHGIGTKKDIKKGIHCLNKASGLNNKEAQLLLAYIYYDGFESIKENKIFASRYFKLAADNGIKTAQSCYGFMLLNGDGIQRDGEEANKYFKLASENKDNDQSKYLKLQINSVSVETRQAIKYFENLAKSGSSKAMISLANLYANGKGIEKDETKAYEYAQQAAKTNDPEGHFLLAYYNQIGLGTNKNLEEAVKHYKIAADGGNTIAQGNLARLYQFGEGTPVDLKSAVKYFKMAADGGDVVCCNSYAFLVSKGIGTKLDMNEAIKYFNKAIEAKDVTAMNNLGIIYLRGESGVKQDAQKAKELFEKAAEFGEPLGYCNIGFIYEKGIFGIKRNIEEARKYYQKAADVHYPYAFKCLERIKNMKN